VKTLVFVASANEWVLNLQHMMVKSSLLMVVIVASQMWEGIKTMVKGGRNVTTCY
jgi:DUF1365 family protein